jgi:RNA recognition motif-containing protein
MTENKLYVGNLYCMATKESLRKLFSKYGRVRQIDMIQGTGFGFVEMSSTGEAERALAELDGSEFLERVIKVKQAESQS